MRIAERDLSTEDWELRIGSEFRDLRISAGLDQSQLAEQAAVSVGAIRGLERGGGSSLKTVIRVARALGKEDWLASIAPAVSVSPLDLVRSGRPTRARVYRARTRGE